MKARFALVPLLVALTVTPASAQLNQVFSDLFNTFLTERLSLSPGEHADHFVPAAETAVGRLTPALNSLIAGNVAAFPLSATATGVTFDFSTGQPVTVLESQGPIFAESANTLGRRRINVGANYTYLSLNRLRGMPAEDVSFVFVHEDVDGNGVLGNIPFEADAINVRMGLDVNANIFALFATYGLTDNLDVGVALPFVSVSVEGTAEATVDSRTFTQSGAAIHLFGGDVQNPILTAEEDYSESASGVGDVSLRAKYRFPIEAVYDIAALLDVRLPTGNDEDFLGTGSLGVGFSLITSAKIGNFTPHANVGYRYRGSDSDSTGADTGDFNRDAISLALGFDQQLANGLTFAVDFLGDFNLGDDPLDLLPTSVDIIEERNNGEATVTRNLELTNVPDGGADRTLSLSVGARYAFSERFQVLGNVLVPLNNGGLRSNVVPTIGAAATF